MGRRRGLSIERKHGWLDSARVEERGFAPDPRFTLFNGLVRLFTEPLTTAYSPAKRHFMMNWPPSLYLLRTLDRRNASERREPMGKRELLLQLLQ